ncbi:MAG: hypothetical protein ABIC40_04295, partial [bacterium]
MNRYLAYQDGELLFEDVALSEISEEMYTPFYVYSKAAILEKVEALKQSFADIKPMIAFSMKALDTTLILKLIGERGCSVQVENVFELERAIMSDFKPTSVIMDSYGLPDTQLEAILKQKPLIINTGNIFELQPINDVAASLDMGVRIGLRINPDIDTGGIFGKNYGARDSRIGIPKEDIDQALALIKNLPQLNLVGLSCHLGSQVVQLAPWVKMTEFIVGLYKDIKGRGFNLEYLDLGGGFPVDYGNGDFLEIKKIARNITPHFKDLDCRVILEPGRYFTAEAGVLVTSVLGVKKMHTKTFVICDAGFSELPRSALYRIDNEVVPVKDSTPAQPKTESGPFSSGGATEPVDLASNPSMEDPGEINQIRMPIPTEFLSVHEAGQSEETPSIPGEPIEVDLVGPG